MWDVDHKDGALGSNEHLDTRHLMWQFPQPTALAVAQGRAQPTTSSVSHSPGTAGGVGGTNSLKVCAVAGNKCTLVRPRRI